MKFMTAKVSPHEHIFENNIYYPNITSENFPEFGSVQTCIIGCRGKDEQGQNEGKQYRKICTDT